MLSISSSIMILTVILFLVATWSSTTYGQDCFITIPANPLTATGMSTPFLVSGASCQQQTAPSFVEATILDPATGALSVYNPLMINLGDTPAAPPVVPKLPANAVVGLWYGTNADTITLQNPNATANALAQGKCVNGIPGSIFGQFASCNGAGFFAAVKAAGAKVVVPPLGTGLNAKPCYTTRSFEVVDMDPSDNVVASYLLLPNGKVAQDTAANKAKFPNATVINNGSDNLLLDLALRPNLGCKAFTVPDLGDPANTRGSLALNEIQAAALQVQSVATVPPNDPMVLVNGAINAVKLNAYRAEVNQVAVNDNPANIANANKNFCLDYKQVGAPSIKSDMKFTKGKPSPAATAVDLFSFLCARFATSFGADGLNCVGQLNVANPVTPVNNAQGVTTNCTFNF